MATYLIDYENVNTDGLNGLSKLSKSDSVVIFYSEKADRMTFGLHRRLNESPASIDYKRVEIGGPNALDFQLVSYLGYLIAANKKENYIIVSNDKGFEYVSTFWSRQKIDIRLTPNISSLKPAEEPALPVKPVPAPPKPQPAAKVTVQQQVPVKPEAATDSQAAEGVLTEILKEKDDVELVKGYIDKYKTKQGLNNALVKKFGNNKASEVYQKIKQYVTDKKGR